MGKQLCQKDECWANQARTKKVIDGQAVTNQICKLAGFLEAKDGATISCKFANDTLNRYEMEELCKKRNTCWMKREGVNSFRDDIFTDTEVMDGQAVTNKLCKEA